MIEKIRELVLEEVKSKEWNWKVHIESVVKFSLILAKEYNANKEVCEISAWLHDIAKMRDLNCKHEIWGAKIAGELLPNYEKIEEVKHCIISHSSDKEYLPQTKEAEIVSNADALSHFENILLLMKGDKYKDLKIDELKVALLRKYAKCWNKLTLEKAKEIALPKYNAIKEILK